MLATRGVSTNETESSNRTKPKKYPTLFGSVWNRSEPIETDLVWFGSRFFISRSVKPMNQSDDNHTPYFTNIIVSHTNLWLGPKLKSNIIYFLIHSVCMDLLFWLCFNFMMFFLEFLCLLMNDACMNHGWLKYLSLMKLFLKNDGWMNLGSYVWNIE